jgi:hypothetical protein
VHLVSVHLERGELWWPTQLRGTAVPGGAVRRSSELLSAEAIQDMSVDQQQQLIKLHDEAVRLGAALTPPMPPPH